ncbi:MAG TPA: RNA polymerase sigma factor [Thermoanaerobaculia bacterium]
MTNQNGGGGGDDLFRSLYKRYYQRMRRFFRSVFKVSEEDAEELTQDAFVRFFKAIREYRGDAEWAFLEAIARNVGYNHIRSLSTQRRGSVRPVSLDDPAAGFQAPRALVTDPIDSMIEGERRQRLREAITKLPKGQREALQWWLDGLSYEEIARLLRSSVDAVKSRIRDGKRLLRERLGVADPEDES